MVFRVEKIFSRLEASVIRIGHFHAVVTKKLLNSIRGLMGDFRPVFGAIHQVGVSRQNSDILSGTRDKKIIQQGKACRLAGESGSQKRVVRNFARALPGVRV